MIADFPSSILLRLTGLTSRLGGPLTLRMRIAMAIYSPKRGFAAPLFAKTGRAGALSKAWPSPP